MRPARIPVAGLAADFSEGERLRALRAGASVLRTRGRRSWFPVLRRAGAVLAEVSFVLPGVARVSVRDTGELIAQSVPGALEVMEPDRSRWGLEGLALEARGVLGHDLVHADSLMSPGERLAIPDDYGSHPGTWRSPDGQDMAEAVGEWLRERRAEFPELQDVPAAAAAGRCCGVFVPAAVSAPAHYLVAHAAMAAFIAGLGLPAATMAELHDSLAELAREGSCSTAPVAKALPGLGLVWCYVLPADLVD